MKAPKTSAPPVGRRSVEQLVRWVESDLIIERRWNLMRKNGTSAATVFDNCVWFTWDDDGIGGENSKEASVELAKAEAVLSALNQGFLTSNRGLDPHAEPKEAKE